MSSRTSSNMIQKKDKNLEVPNDEINELIPNPRGLYTLCFHCNNRQPPLNDEDEIKEFFSSVAPVAEVTCFKGLQFVRFTTKEFAIKAWKAFRTNLLIRVADRKNNSLTFKDQNSNSSPEHSGESKKPKSHKKPQDHSTNRNDNDRSGVMLYMGNIVADSTEEEIQEFLSGINVLEWKILHKKNKCYAFLRVSNQKEAEKAVRLFHNTSFKNRTIILRVFRAFDPEAKSATDHSISPPSKELTNSKRGKKSVKSNDSTSPRSLDLDSIKARMPPLEDIGSSSDDDDDDNDDSNDIDLESAINGNIQQTNLNNSYHLFVGNFPYGTSEVNLIKLFQPYQPIKAIIINGNDRSRSTQAFVCFSNPRDLQKAVTAVDCTEYKNQILLVTSSVCRVNIRKDQNLQCTITAVPGESQYQRKVMLDSRYEKCRLWLNNTQRFNPELMNRRDK